MATPISLSNVRFLRNVPLKPDYKHVRWFPSLSAQTNYFLGRPTVFVSGNNNYVRKDQTIRVGVGYDQMLEANYFMFQNEEYNNKWFYAFITNIEYVSVGVTLIHFQLDVIQTWQFDFEFKHSFVEREHQNMWDSNGNPVVNTLDEGLDYGTDYDIMESTRYKPYGEVFFLVVICKEAMHEAPDHDWSGQILASYNGMPQPLTYYFHPIRLGSDQRVPRVSVGNEVPPISDPLEFLQRLMEIEGAVNNVVSIYITEFNGVEAEYSTTADRVSLGYNEDEVEIATISDEVDTIHTLCVKNVDTYYRHPINIGNKWSGFIFGDESKLNMYPYCVITLTDYQGNQVDLHPEYVPADSNGNSQLVCMGSMGTSSKVAYYVDGYNMRSSMTEGERRRVGLQNALIKSQPNDISVISEYLTAMLQGNRNSIQNQANTVAFNGIMNAVSGVTNIGANMMARNPVGAVNATGSTIQGMGNSLLQIEGIQSKLKDADNIPPNMSKMGSNTAFDLGNTIGGCFLVKKQIKPEYRRKLTAYFKMFGYKTQLVKIPNLATRQNYNFVKTVDCNIQGNFNTDDLETIKSIFNNGVTLWHTNDIGNYDLPNEVR